MRRHANEGEHFLTKSYVTDRAPQPNILGTSLQGLPELFDVYLGGFGNVRRVALDDVVIKFRFRVRNRAPQLKSFQLK